MKGVTRVIEESEELLKSYWFWFWVPLHYPHKNNLVIKIALKVCVGVCKGDRQRVCEGEREREQKNR